MASKGSVRIIPVDFAGNKLEKSALFLRHKQLPEPRKEFKKYASEYLIGLAVADLADDVHQLKQEAEALATKESDLRLDKFAETDIEAYLARKKADAQLDDSADE